MNISNPPKDTVFFFLTRKIVEPFVFLFGRNQKTYIYIDFQGKKRIDVKHPWRQWLQIHRDAMVHNRTSNEELAYQLRASLHQCGYTTKVVEGEEGVMKLLLLDSTDQPKD